MTKMNVIPAVLPDYQAELLALIRSLLSPKALKDQVSNYHASDLADSFPHLKKEDREKLYRILDLQEPSDVFEHLDNVAVYYAELSMRKKVDVLTYMEADKAAALLHHLSRNERNALIDMVADVYSHIIDEDRRYNAQRFEEQFYNAKGLKNVEEGKTAPMPKFETSVELLDPMAEVQKKSKVEEEKTVENSADENAALLAKLLSNPDTAALSKALAKTI